MGGKRGQTRQWRASVGILSIFLLLVLLGMLLLLWQMVPEAVALQRVEAHIDVNMLWNSPLSDWVPSSAPRTYWPAPSRNNSNGYLIVRCNGGLNQQRSAICNAVVAARIMNATLVLPELEASSFWKDHSGFSGTYDVQHFIKFLESDVNIVELSVKQKKNLKAFTIRPPRDAPVRWYEDVALAKMKRYGAIYLTPFSHRLAEELENPEYARLRCRVNYHALKFHERVVQLSNTIVDRLRSQGRFMAIHLRFELDMIAFAGCLDIFQTHEQKALRKYREQNFAKKSLIHDERRKIGKCPLTPQEVGEVLRATGFDNSTRMYIAAGNIFGGERYFGELVRMFPLVERRITVATQEELQTVYYGSLGPAVDYMVCLNSDIFMPTYDGPSNFANNVLGHRSYQGFRTSLQPDRKALARIFSDSEKGRLDRLGFDNAVKSVMIKGLRGAHRRVNSESFYTNPWPECFCRSNHSSFRTTNLDLDRG